MRRLARRLFDVVVACALVGCGGQKGPPKHPVGEMSARASSRLDVIALVVADPARAEQVRQVYLRLAALGQEFDLARARSLTQARATAEKRSPEKAPSDAEGAAELELVLAPPIEEGKAIVERYVGLMLEVRSLLTEDEFEKLNRVR